MTLEHVADVRRKTADLQKLTMIRADMAAQCEGGPIPECPVVDALSSMSAEARSRDAQGRRHPGLRSYVSWGDLLMPSDRAMLGAR